MLIKKNSWIALGASLIGSAAGFCALTSKNRSSQPQQSTEGLPTAVSRPGDLTLLAFGAGPVAPAKEINLGFAEAGSLLESNDLEGDEAKAGCPLARLLAARPDEEIGASTAEAELSVTQCENAWINSTRLPKSPAAQNRVVIYMDMLLARRKSAAVSDLQLAVHNLEDLSETRASNTATFLTPLTCVSAVSLVIGGVGIMILMVVSVAERTQGIGIHHSVGAAPSDLLWHFLTEELLLGLVGGLIGVNVGIGGSILTDVLGGMRAEVVQSWILLAFSSAEDSNGEGTMAESDRIQIAAEPAFKQKSPGSSAVIEI